MITKGDYDLNKDIEQHVCSIESLRVAPVYDLRYTDFLASASCGASGKTSLSTTMIGRGCQHSTP